jgi:hypothetical protein
MIKRVTLSLILTVIISAGIGFVLKNFVGFWQGFTAAIIIHFLAFYIFNPEKKDRIVVESEQLAFNDLLQTQTVNINCPCGQSPISAPILLNTENIFSCKKCLSKYRVDITFESILLTEPFNIANAFDALKQNGTTL